MACSEPHDPPPLTTTHHHSPSTSTYVIVSSWQEQVSADSAPGAPMKAPTQDVWRALESKGGMAMVGFISTKWFWGVWGSLGTLFWMLLDVFGLFVNGFKWF